MNRNRREWHRAKPAFEMTSLCKLKHGLNPYSLCLFLRRDHTLPDLPSSIQKNDRLQTIIPNELEIRVPAYLIFLFVEIQNLQSPKPTNSYQPQITPLKNYSYALHKRLPSNYQNCFFTDSSASSPQILSLNYHLLSLYAKTLNFVWEYSRRFTKEIVRDIIKLMNRVSDQIQWKRLKTEMTVD